MLIELESTSNARPSTPAIRTIFDAAYYLRRYPDIAAAGVDPLAHFLHSGLRERRNPCALFDTNLYLQQVPELARLELNPLIHYAGVGALAGLEVSSLFNAEWYLAHNPDAADAARPNPLLHYLTSGAAAGLEANPLFDQAWYLQRHPQALRGSRSALEHYAEYGLSRKLSPHPAFDGAYYLERYPDVAASGMNPLAHYLLRGKAEGRVIKRKSAWQTAADDNQRLAKTIPPLPPLAPSEAGLPGALADYLTRTRRDDILPSVKALRNFVVKYGDREEAFVNSQARTALINWLTRASACLGQHETPDVSIIIPVYDKLPYTLAAIASILCNNSRYTYEIIVADDCSTDDTAEVIASIGGCVRHSPSAHNLRFLQNCNRAAESARGRFLAIVNNDTLMLPGWLDNLIAPLEDRHDVGMTGSKLINDDGALQEAGGIIWSDGSAWNFGRDKDPHLPQFNYAKEIDYCSGASVAFRTSLWRELDGFDPHFAPAYCEDSDIAFRTRKAGLKVLYCPHSEVIHYEGVSHGRDTAQGMKAYQVANTKKLAERWRPTMSRDHFQNGEHVHLARDRSRHKPHILFVDHYVPQWDKDAGSRTMFDCLKFFIRQGFHVTLWPDNLFWDEPYVLPLQKLGVEVLYGSSLVGKFESWWLENGRYYQHAFLSRCHIAVSYVDAVRLNPDCTIIYYGHDLPWKRFQAEYEVTQAIEKRDEADRLKRLEDAVSSKADYILYPSEDECDYARKAFPNVSGVVEMPAWLYEDAALAAAQIALPAIQYNTSCMGLFVGGFRHGPNVDGLQWFLDEVMPLVLAREPRFILHIAGSHMPPALAARANDSIKIEGWVSDEEMAALTARTACTLAPLRFGAGVKGKVVHALASGSPVVSTSVGMQGIPNAGEIAFVGDTAQDFADALIQCLADRTEAQHRAARALSVVKSRYSNGAMASAFAPFLTNASARPPSGTLHPEPTARRISPDL